MNHPELDNILLNPREREELQRLFDYTEKLREEMKRDPEVARRLLERIGYFEMMEDERAEQEALREMTEANDATPNAGVTKDR